jgi:hypothetical protein
VAFGVARRSRGREVRCARAASHFVETRRRCITEVRGALTRPHARRRDVRAGAPRREEGLRPCRCALREYIADFGMDTITLAGPLAAKLRAIREAGFGAGDAGRARPGRPRRRLAVQRWGRSRPAACASPGFQVLRDFEGLSGHLHGYKVDIARSMIEMCAGRCAARCCWPARPPAQHASGERRRHGA